MFPSREDIQHLYDMDGSVATLYLRLGIETGTTTDRALALRWRALRQHLTEIGADDRDVKALEECVGSAGSGPRTLVAFVSDGQPHLVAELEDCSAPDSATYGPLPVTAPLLRWQRTRIPYVVALIDRAGAELSAYDGGAQPYRTETVIGPDDEIERNAPGGPAQMRYQHRAEDSWQHNADEVARRVVRMAESVHARLVLAAGDVRAVQLLGEALPEHLRPILRSVSADGEQPPEGPARIRPSSIAAVRDEVVREQSADLLRRASDAIGVGTHAVQGVEPTIDALRSATVATLLVVDRPDDERTAYVDRRVTNLALSRDLLGPEAREVRLLDGLVRTAIGTRADVVVLDPDEMELSDGVAALLRS